MSDTARAAAVVFVDPDASAPVHDGSSWADAFVDLQEALDAAEAAARAVNEIWGTPGSPVSVGVDSVL